MYSFSSFLQEAKISKNNLNKVADVFKRMFERHFQTKLYRYAGDTGFVEIKSGIGILYFYNRNKAIRLNYISGAIQSITLWNQYKLGESGDYTLDLGGLGLTQAGKKILDLIKTPKTGKTLAYPEILEQNMLSEAKRVSPEDFYQLVLTNKPSNIDMRKVPWNVISDVAAANDRQIPTAVRKTHVKGTKGKNSQFDLTKFISPNEIDDPIDKPAKSNEPIYYLKLTAQDPITKKFQSVKGDKKAEQLLTKFAKAVDEPDYKQDMEDPDTLFGKMRDLTKVVSRGFRNSLIIYGGPGTGKTFVVTQTIKDEGLKKNQDWFLIKGKITTSSLYQTLFIHRKGSLLLFDDTDSVWGDSDSANILKAALDSYDERTISWVSPRTTNVSLMTDDAKEEYNDTIDVKLQSDPEAKIKLPSEFNYEGKIIFISNLPYEKFDDAVLTRSAKIDMTITQEQMFMRMKSILPHLGSKEVPVEAKEEILEFLQSVSRAGILNGVSMRTYVAAEDLYRSGLPNWKDLLGNV